MAHTDALRELDPWLQKADTLLEEEGRAAVVDEDTLGSSTVGAGDAAWCSSVTSSTK